MFGSLGAQKYMGLYVQGGVIRDRERETPGFVVLIIKPTRCSNSSNLFWNKILHDSHSSCVHHQGFLLYTQERYMSYLNDIPLLCAQWKVHDDGQRKCPKHVEFYSKNKFEKLVHLVGFIIRIYHNARSDVHHCCAHNEKLLMMYRGTVRNM